MDKRTGQAERENIPYFRQPRHQEPEAELLEILRANNDADVYRGRQAGDLSESLPVPLLWRLIRWHLATFRARAYQQVQYRKGCTSAEYAFPDTI